MKKPRGRRAIFRRVFVAFAPYGRGVFAKKAIRQGKVVGRISGQLIGDVEHGSDYCIDMKGQYCLEPYPPLRYLNHSCEPNCELVEVEADPECGLSTPTLWLDSLRDITEGEQLTIDYSWPASGSIPCQCGSSKCRGWIVDPEEITQLPTKDPPEHFTKM